MDASGWSFGVKALIAAVVGATGMSAATLASFAVAQTQGVEAAAWLQAYGAWAGLVTLGGVITAVVKAYVDVRDRHEKEKHTEQEKRDADAKSEQQRHDKEIKQLNEKLFDLLVKTNKTMADIAAARRSSDKTPVTHDPLQLPPGGTMP